MSIPSLSSLIQYGWLLIEITLPLLGTYAYWCYNRYEDLMGGTRLARNHKDSPSNKQPPDIKGFDTNKSRILANSRYHANFDTCELLHDLEDMEVTKKENKKFRELMKRTNSLGSGKLNSGSLSLQAAEKLNMDHVYISFFNFFWGYCFIGPFSYLLWLKLGAWLRIKKFLVKKGYMKMKPVDYPELVGKLCLEQSQVIHFYARTKKDSELGDIAGFFFADFPYFDNNCKAHVANLFAVDINLKTKKMVKAKLDDAQITAKQAAILLWFNNIGPQHVKLHALANWGINLDDREKARDPFFHRNSVITSFYNFLGYTVFHTFFTTWEKQGLLSKGYQDQGWKDCINIGVQANIWQHAQILEMLPYSRFVNFIVKVRIIFMNEFGKYKDMFPGVHGEAMFVGTIMHSLDHLFLDLNMEDPLWLDIDDPEFGKMAEIGRIVKMGFVQDVPGLYFHKRFKGSGHPFYEAVYERAAKIDKFLADNMDTCIVK